MFIRALKRLENPTAINALSSVLAIIGGLLVGLLIMLIVSPSSAFEGLITITFGGLNDGLTSIGSMLYYGTPLILTGLSVAFAFRTGLFNIGATGQLTVGAFTAVFIGYNWTFLGPFQWLVALLGAMIVGGLWGAIPGILKAFRNVHEVVSSIMLNYVAMYLVTELITKYIYNTTYGRAYGPVENGQIPSAGIRDLFSGSNVHWGFFIAILFVLIAHIILNKTTFGYELKAVGFNKDAAKYAGMNEKRNIILSMTIAGIFAGAAGAMMYLVGGRTMAPSNNLLPEGFTGIAVSLLGLNAPIGVLVVGIFYGSLQQGGYYLQEVSADFMSEMTDIIISVVIYFSALALFLRRYVTLTLKRRKEQIDEKLIEDSASDDISEDKHKEGESQ
ncbi:MAG: ABC transporter permease [Bacillota bacterium]